MPNYYIAVHIKFDNQVQADSKEEAISILRSMFKEDYGIELNDDEIVSVEETE